MTPSEYRALKSELRGYTVETHTDKYPEDDYNMHQVCVFASKCSLMCLVSELNEIFPELAIRERDIQETGASCQLDIDVMEDYE